MFVIGKSLGFPRLMPNSVTHAQIQLASAELCERRRRVTSVSDELFRHRERLSRASPVLGDPDRVVCRFDTGGRVQSFHYRGDTGPVEIRVQPTRPAELAR